MALTGYYHDEPAACAALELAIGEHFRLVREVQLLHYSGKRLRIDYVGVPRMPFPAPLIGIEVKAGYGRFHDFACALHQARAYRAATIVDRRAKHSAGLVLPFVFVFPAPPDVLECGMVAGAVRLAGLDKVGVITTERYGGLTLRMSAERFWSASYGARADADHWGTRLRVGSR